VKMMQKAASDSVPDATELVRDSRRSPRAAAPEGLPGRTGEVLGDPEAPLRGALLRQHGPLPPPLAPGLLTKCKWNVGDRH